MLALIAVGVLAVAVGVAWAVSSNGPYYAMPAWDQKLPASTRFVLLLDWEGKAVLDRETGLVWEQEVSALESIQPFQNTRCRTSIVGGRAGWHLPSFPQLASLVDPTTPTAPKLPPGHPFVGVSGTAFYATNSPTGDGFPVFMRFDTSENTRVSTVVGLSSVRAWCVRGGEDNAFVEAP
jgi:hypothetical protein